MRVLLATPYDLAVPGGVNQQALGLLEALTRKGVEAKLVGPSSDPRIGTDSRVVPMGRIWTLPLNGAVTRITMDLRLLPEYRRLIKEFAPDVIHVHEPVVPLPSAALLWLAPQGTLRVGTFHTYSERSRGYLWAWPWVRAIWSRLHVRVAVSEAAKEFATRYHGATFEVIPNAVDRPPSSGTRREASREGPTQVLFVGRMDESRKGFDVLVRAVRRIEADSPGTIAVTAVGRGAEGWQREAEGLPITFAGEVGADELEARYSACDLTVVPSRGGESFGLVPLEAMVRGVPVIASRIEGYAVWMDGAAELVPPGDAAALAGSLSALGADTARRMELGRAGQERAGRFLWDQVVERWLDLYRRERARPAPAGPLERAEDALYSFLDGIMHRRALDRVRRHPPTATSQRGRNCHCAPSPIHLVHSEGLRESCDFVVDFGANVTHRDRPPIPVELLADAAVGLREGATVHVKAELLGQFREHLLPKITGTIVLVTGDSDYGPLQDHSDLLENPKIRHWFAQNCGRADPHPRLTRIPIGFDNPVYNKLVKRLGFFIAMLRGRMPFDLTFSRNDIGDQSLLQALRSRMRRPTVEREARALCTFHQNQKLVSPNLERYPARLEAWSQLKEMDFCHFVSRRIPQEECWKLHEEFAFEVSPRGNGLDCFRTWEALFLGTIPIVKTSPLDTLYRSEGLPVVIVDSWSDITRDRLLQWREELAPLFDDRLLERLTNQYWVGRIRQAGG